MTEREWAESRDPAAMVRVARGRVSRCCGCRWSYNAENDTLSMLPGEQCCPRCDNAPFLDGCNPVTSDRKFRLWVEACRAAGYSPRDGRINLDTRKGLAAAVSLYSSDLAGMPMTARADLLREIVGNPFRPVTLPNAPDCVVCGGSGRFAVGSGEDAEPMRCRCCPWRTPDVIRLAESAYEERERLCIHEVGGPLARCGRCGDTGIIDDGTLDPLTLAALADALLEAGCPEEVECGGCVDGDVGCPECEGLGVYYDPPYSLKRYTCPHCTDGLCDARCLPCKGTGRVPHPLIEHLRSPDPHVKGCWVIDTLTGRE